MAALAAVRGVVSAVARNVVGEAGDASERIQNGNFDDGDNGWEVGADWAIIAGQAVGTTGLTELVNILSTPIDSFADISAFSALLINPAPDSVIIYLRSESRDDVIYFGAGDGVIGPDTAVAGSHGPYTHLVIVNNDGADPISIDNVTLVV